MRHIKFALITGSCLLILAVLLGAFGAHALESRIDEDLLDTYLTANRYHFYHALGMLFVGILAWMHNSRLVQWSMYILLLGILLFSGSLYLLAIGDILAFNTSWLGLVTPVGGLCFIFGWFLLFMHVLNWKNP
jgi:uncharacterized membrane protein YgdD (TMEM256/DUF423 family)